MRYTSFTSESVSEGHPDKLCDQISDAILDAYLERDPKHARVACEVMAKDNRLIIGGETFSKEEPISNADIEQIVRKVVADIGYTDVALGIDANSCEIHNIMGMQSAEIHEGVDREDPAQLGAGDQGLMFGYASNETDALMPAPIYYAHQLMQRQAELRRSGDSLLGPDAKSQVTVRYGRNCGRPKEITKVVLSTQHLKTLSDLNELRSYVRENIINHTLPSKLIENLTEADIFINPAGSFHTGGPEGDCGLTGRKIIVDTYGGMAHHGGGAFSGKDPSKVDRSAAYYCRYAAKNIVAAGLAEICEIQVAYAIGHHQPVSLSSHTFDTGDTAAIDALLRTEKFDWTPRGIIERLELEAPIYLKTAAYGHFGRKSEGKFFPWERTDLAKDLA